MKVKTILAALVAIPLASAFSMRSVVPRRFVKQTYTIYKESFRFNVHNKARQPLQMAAASENAGPSCWQPKLRKAVASLAILGAIETAYLTYIKLNTGIEALCGTNGGCSDVLTGPYSVIPSTDIPLAAAGLVAYSIVALLALLPLNSTGSDHNAENRIWLTAVTTAMGTFSIFLLSLLFFVLREACMYCIISACLSIGMAATVWIGGCLPGEARQRGMVASAGSFTATVLAALALFFTVEGSSYETQFVGSPGGTGDSMLMASSEGIRPPPITTTSSERALSLSSQLQALDARMYGAVSKLA